MGAEPQSEVTRLVVGLGNPLRGDDGVGREVVRRLRRRLKGGHRVRLIESSGEDLAELLTTAGIDRVVVVDAAFLGRDPGDWVRIQLEAPGEWPEIGSAGLTHGWGLIETLRLIDAMRIRRAPVTVFAVQAGRLGWGPGLSLPVRRAAARVAEAVHREMKCAGRPEGKVFAGGKEVRDCRRATVKRMEETGGVPWRRSS